MVRVTNDLALSPEHLTLYYVSDPLLGHLPILIFHGPSTTANYTLNSSRVQVHVFTPAGFQSYPRLTISPNSAPYSVVDYLPREFQGDEVYRGLAFGLFKYFSELSDGVKSYLKNLYLTRGGRPGSVPELFGEQHAADLVKSVIQSENTVDVVATLQEALQTQHLNNVDIDFVLPPGAIVPLQAADLEEVPDNDDDILDPTLRQYGGYTPLVKLLGEPVFLPTSKLRRAPSKPTSLNRGRSFTKHQRIELRLKLGELVDTEVRYVQKLRELVDHIAKDFRESAKKRDPASKSPSEEELEKLFPTSADEILRLNSSFLQELQQIMDSTEDEAALDMDSATIHIAGSKPGSPAKSKDPSGVLSMARLFLERFPKFTECYQDYIKASQHFPTLLNSFMDEQSTFRQRVAQTGEQAIRSILIEPVQRLPRYSLLIDQIVGCLPMTHPALQPMLKSRDIITNICSMDDPHPNKPHVTSRLRNMVESWPMDLEPQGRLIGSVDFVELDAPYRPDANEPDKPGVFLLFSDCIIIMKKTTDKITGRDLIREVDKPSAAGLLISMTNAAGGPPSYDFVLTGWHNLADVRFTESSDGTLVWMTSTADMKGVHTGEHKISKAPTSRCFLLKESLQGKAAKFGEDIVKARVEARFSESEREDPCWTLRSTRMPDTNLGLHAAVYQEGASELIDGRREPAPIRVVVDHEKGTKGAPVGHYGVEIVVDLQSNDLKRVAMVSMGLNGKQFQDDVALEDFLPTLSRRIIQLVSSQFNVSNISLAAALVSYYSKTLRNLPLSTRAEKTRSFLPSSPVKLFSNLWAGSSTPDVTSSKHQRHESTMHQNNSQSSFLNALGSMRGKDDRIATEEIRPDNPLVRLEQTFIGYVAAVQSRKGAIIGRALLNRSFSDELLVNELYNKLIESPYDFDASADVSTEVIFVAFEKFLRIAWAEQMGPVITMQLLDTLLERANKRVPGDFADFVNYLFSDIAPQNRRAFTSLIKLLADLLDGCGNDSDRGVLTLTFAEMLVSEDGTAHNYINLLDRLVEDCDRMFEEPGLSHGMNNMGSDAYASVNSATRGGKSYTPSLTSNTSSIRRKFGFDTLLRQNSKDERGSVWRTLSKHRNPATGEATGFNKPLGRSGSVDDDSVSKRMVRRPGSRDRPPISGASDSPSSRPGSSHRMDFPLDTIGEPDTDSPTDKGRYRKRRSSLSDLKTLMASATITDEPLQPLQQTSENSNSSPKPPTPSKIPVSPGPNQSLRSPARQKENVSNSSNATSPGTTGSGKKISHSRQGSMREPHRRTQTLSTSNIPTLRPWRSEATGADSPPRTTSPTRPGNAKLRIQSPQKLRERLEAEKKVVEEVDTFLKSELSKIGDEMAWLSTSSAQTPADLRGLASSVRTLEDKLLSALEGISEKQTVMQRDMETTVKASEAKAKAIDQLYKEAMAENELLYERFHGELGRIVKAIKGKGKEDKEELLEKLKEQGEEAARVKKENGRLRREMASLRAALKAT
ncbi:RhoGEF domain, partial [Geosmithia morbida]